MANPQLENGHVKIANEIVEALAVVNLSAYESRILWCIFRKTYGWGKKTDRISYTQFEESTHIERRHISRAVNALKDKGIINCSGSGYQLEYSIQKDYSLWKSLPKEATNIDTERGNDLTPKEATNTDDKSLPIQGDLTPIQGESLPKEVSKSLPKEATTKAIKHITKDTIQKQESFPVLPEWIKRETFDAFLEMRKKIKAPLTDYAIRQLLTKLTKLKLQGDDPNEILDESIMNNWKGIFALKKNGGNGNGHNQGHSERGKIPDRNGYTPAPADPVLDARAAAYENSLIPDVGR